MTTTREPRQAGPRAWGAGLARAAVLVAAITVAARVVGFGRWLVFSKTVGDTCLGDAYNTANQLPNVTFEIVAGGALASVVVPVLAGALAQPDGAGRADAERTLSALLSWTLLLLTPVALLAAVLAGPYAEFMLAGHPGCSDSTGALATRMLVVFAPQVWFYGIAVVLSGALQAQRRFVAAAAAPLASSVVVVAAYAGFGLLADGRLGAAEVPGAAIGLLAVGRPSASWRSPSPCRCPSPGPGRGCGPPSASPPAWAGGCARWRRPAWWRSSPSNSSPSC